MTITDEQLRCAGVGISHHFGGGVYAKETAIPAGASLQQHAHPFEHLSWLSSGTVMVEVEDEGEIVTGPRMLTIAAGKRHRVTALTDALWLCIHATEETDPAAVDAAILNEDPAHHQRS